jgi:RNA polymerase sigma factor (sigma-70 family)
LGTLLRHVKILAAGRCVREWSDRQLLDAFAARGSEAAFTALVSRHGPMVLRVCRRVLNHEQDAEDAFQATFLVLARSIGSIRKRDSLANWLHGVAYRTAMKAKRGAARRRNHEARLRAVALQTAAEPTWNDVQAVLDEEIQRLPSCFREAFVLCVLEGKSGPEAAAALGCKEGTVKSRVNRARRLLQEQLGRRGIKLSGLLAALTVAEGKVLAVPASLARETIHLGLLVAAGKSAAGQIPPHLATLAQGVTGAMLQTKIKIATAIVLAACALAGAGRWTRQLLAARPTEPSAAKETAKLVGQKETAEENREATFAGRVLDPDGNPIKGAKLLFLYSAAKKIPEKVWATSTADGTFRFTVPPGTLDRARSENLWDNTYVLAAAEGYGFAYAPLGKPGAAGITLRLTKDDVPLRGRVLDLQGKPVAGATVRIGEMLFVPQKGDLGPWLKALLTVKEGAGRTNPEQLLGLYSPAFGQVLPPVTTGANGRFEIKGIGRERVAHLRIEGPTIATRLVRAMTRPGEIVQAPKNPNDPEAEPPVYHGSSFDLVVAPTRPVIGVVRDKDTGKPLEGVTVHSSQIAGKVDLNLVRTTTDREGRFKLVGLPKGDGHQIVAQDRERPYLAAVRDVPDLPGLEPVTIDFALKRGVWVQGHVTDKATGRPQMASVRYFCFSDNPSAKELSGLQNFNWYFADENGRFRVVALPGPGLIGARAYRENYRMGVGADEIKGARREIGFLTQPHICHPGNFHTLAGINPKPGDDSVTCDLALDPGRTVKGTVLGPDGKPLAGARVSGLKDMVYWENDALAGAAFEARGLPADKPRLLQFVHESQRLAGSLLVGPDDKGPLTVKLGPWGTLTGRVMTPDGDPLTDVEVASANGIVPDPALGSFRNRIRPDKEGRFRIEGLIPGLKYNLSVLKGYYGLQIVNGKSKDLTIAAGETKDLGEIRVKPME